jgi:hypothetical protein
MTKVAVEADGDVLGARKDPDKRVFREECAVPPLEG